MAPPPVQAADGRVTFASLNKPDKLNPQVLEVWARVLAEVPDSRLMILVLDRLSEGGPAPPTIAALSRLGVDPRRVVAVPAMSRRKYLERYGEVDVALDPWPYNGHTTTLDALWMGVPVVAIEARITCHVRVPASCACLA